MSQQDARTQLENPNVRLAFAYRISYSVTQGLWNLGVGSTYIYMLEKGSNTKVGIAQCIQGTTLALAALPAGWCADKYRRDLIMRLSGFLMLGGIGLTVLALYAPQRPLTMMGLQTDTFFVLICAALAVWGMCQGVGTAPLEALLADSVPTGARSKLYSWLFAATAASYALGPALSAALFAVIGNQWTSGSLRVVLLVAMGLSLVPAAVSMLFDDRQALGSLSEGLLASPELQQAAADEEKAERAKQRLQTQRRGGLPLTALPFVLCSSDIISFLGAGLTVKYFPLWLYNRVGMSPVGLSVVQASMPLCVGVASLLATQAAAGIGRVQAMIGVRMLAVVLTAVIAQFEGLWALKAAILPIYVVRCGLANSTYPISKSVLMDYVTKSRRARWNSVEAVGNFGWSGTAFLGGVLIDAYGYGIAFHVTALVQLLGVLPLFLLLPMVPRREVPASSSTAQLPGSEESDALQADGTGREAREQNAAGPGPRHEQRDGGLDEPLLSSK